MNALRLVRRTIRKLGMVGGVVAGIGGYGNCMGIPTVGGETAASCNGNILVNAMTVGVADTDKIFYSAAAGIGNPVDYVGSKTGATATARPWHPPNSTTIRRETPHGRGRRSVYRETTAGSLPGADGY